MTESPWEVSGTRATSSDSGWSPSNSAARKAFARSAYDVSLRRLANYSLSPALKSAFEQIYGAPYLARLLFAELGRGTTPDSYLRLDYDGSIRTNGGGFGRSFEQFGVISGTKDLC
jgi:proteasome alpha subunit